MQTIINLPTDSWTQLGGSSLTVALVEALGDGVKLHVGSAAPVAGAGGFTLPSGVALSVPDLAALGGRVYVRATFPGRSIRYVAA